MHSTSAAPERILLYGMFGGGKSYSWLTLLQFCYDNDIDINFFVIGTELGAVDRMKDKWGKAFEKLVAVHVDANDWYELDAAKKLVLPLAKKDDVIVIEGIDKPWDYVQQLYDKLHGSPVPVSDVDPFAMERSANEVERDWTKVNGVYYGWINEFLRSPAHVIACGPQDEVRMPSATGKGWQDDSEVREQFSRFGFKPAGQKKLGHHFHSIIWCRNPRKDVYTMTTVDDHARDRMDNQTINSFVFDYLVNIAGWEL